MKNYESLFAAYLFVWAIFFVYQISVGRRLSALQEEMKRISEKLGHGSRSDSTRSS